MKSTMREATAAVFMSVATVAILAGCSATPAVEVSTAAATGTVKGVLTVTDAGNINASSQGAMPCSTTTDSGYGDIHDGAEVDAVDASGKVLAFASLQPGLTPGMKALNNSCAFGFSIKGVPRGEKIYGLQFGRRGTIHYKASVMFGGHADISIGG